jgi:hypothetical protein
MFYAKKYVFFVIVYFFSLVLYYFINKQIMISQNLSAFFIYPFVIFAAIVFVSFLSAILVSLVYKCLYALLCVMFKIKKREISFNVFWTLFSVFCYLLAAAAFFKTTQY